MLDIPTRHVTYEFPFDSISLKYKPTGGYAQSEIVQLTRWRAWWFVDRPWRQFRGPYVKNYKEPEDHHWRWTNYVRRLRTNVHAKCAALRTSDGKFQGATIYRRDGTSLLVPNTQAVYVEYLAAAPWNRQDYARTPLYRGVGEGLMYLVMLESYQWDLGGRVALFSLPRALDFYKRLDFVQTGDRSGRMIHCELPPDAAVDRLKKVGLI